MWVESCSPLAYAHVDSLIKQSGHHLKVNQVIKRCTKARSSDQDRILVIKIFDRRRRWKYRAHCGDYPLIEWEYIKSSKLISTFDTFLLVMDELQLSATDSVFYFNPLLQISTKNAADPIANEGTSRDEYCGWGISASIRSVCSKYTFQSCDSDVMSNLLWDRPGALRSHARWLRSRSSKVSLHFPPLPLSSTSSTRTRMSSQDSLPSLQLP